MGNDWLGLSEPQATPLHLDTLPDSQDENTMSSVPRLKSKYNVKLFLLFSIFLVALVGASVAAYISIRARGSGSSQLKPTEAISRACSKTQYQSLCVNALLDFPGSLTASDTDLIHISFNMTLQRVGNALSSVTEINNLEMDTLVRSAYEDCLELMEDSMDQLSQSLLSVQAAANSHDIITWLSAALTNQDTCIDGLSEVQGGYVKDQMFAKLHDLSELVSNCLAIYAAGTGDDDFSGVPIGNRRLMSVATQYSDIVLPPTLHDEFPGWLGRRERRLLEMPVAGIQADIVVSKDGTNGSVKTIAEAIKKAPEHSVRRTIIYVRAGRYEEKKLKVGKKKINLMFVGDGKDKTVITGGLSASDKVTTFHTASFAATGAGFIARDMTFENYAGPYKHQAVALRVSADHSVIYRCNIVGYQDTLYVHSQRQFFRECAVYGTVDFIFGNAAVVFQNCSLYARKPLPTQKNTITAQNRKDPNQNTGISIHACQVVPTPDLEASKGNYSTYLGRPWKLYSRTVYMLSYLGDHIHPNGWLEWNSSVPVDKLYYGEYMNYGPGAALGQRVKWPGFHAITSVVEASKFTVAQFISGSSWLPSTGVAFLAGLSS